MNREFVLRDNEVAINRPDGTVIIMNLNALRELKGDSAKDKEIRELRLKLTEAEARIERYNEANESAVRTANARLKMVNDLKLEVEGWKNRHKAMSEDRNRLAAELEKARNSSSDQVEELNKTLATVRKQRDEALSDKFTAISEIEKRWKPRVACIEQELNESEHENDFLTKEICKKNAEIQKLQQKLDQYNKQHVVLFGPTADLPSSPDKMPTLVYIASTGEVFFSQQDVEKAYNLAKGSVSAYFNSKQKYLYARDPYGNRITDNQTGKDVTIGLVQRFASMVFVGCDINKPDFDNYESAISCAKRYVKE